MHRLVVKRAAPIPKTPEKDSWVEAAGGLPPLLDRVAAHIFAGGNSKSRSYGGAVNKAKQWCASGNAKWCKVVAQWDALKAKAKAKASGVSGATKADAKADEESGDREFIKEITGEDPGDLSEIDLSGIDFSEFENVKSDEQKRAEKAQRTPGSLRWIETQVRTLLNPPPASPEFGPPSPVRDYFFIRDVFPERVIVESEMQGKLFAYPYTVDNSGLTLGTPEEVVQEYVPVKPVNSQNSGGVSQNAS